MSYWRRRRRDRESIKLSCEGGCGKVWEGQEYEEWRHGRMRVIEAICEPCYRAKYPGSADLYGFVGFIDGWLLIAEQVEARSPA